MEKLAEMLVPAEALRPFLVDHVHIKTSLSFELLWRKTVFFGRLAQTHSLKESVAAIWTEDFLGLLKESVGGSLEQHIESLPGCLDEGECVRGVGFAACGRDILRSH